MRSIFKLITSRLFLTILLLILQITVLGIITLYLSTYYIYFYSLFLIVSAIVGIHIINKNQNPIYKLAWLMPVLLIPVFGSLLYLFFGKKNKSHYTNVKSSPTSDILLKIFNSEQNLFNELKKENPFAAKQSKYILEASGQPVWKRTYTDFLTPGEMVFMRLVEELKKAKKFIFMEYFIIDQGEVWQKIFNILAKKANEGVEVRFIYDDFGTIRTLPAGFQKTLEDKGIRTVVFNHLRPSLDGFMNYRDHRKITVIDGNVGFTGGINLADEYINKKVRYGYWKDASIMIKGDAVINLTNMFLNMWEFALEQESPEEYQKYFPTKSYPTDGYVQPFDDSPIDTNQTGELVYINMINSATKYVYISTPYLIIDYEMMTALCLCARNGVDVRIVTPYIPDKWYVHIVTRSYYRELMKAGVKIYEFKPGFIHSKTVVVDDEFAVVGTINFDFRSFYMHFECGVWMYKSRAVQQVYNDYLKILQASFLITEKYMDDIPVFKKFLSAILKPFGPIM